MTATATLGKRARYVEARGEGNRPGKIRIESARWTVDGPHKLHEFRYILEAETLDAGFIRRNDWVEHWIDGRRVDAFQWGHGQTEAYCSSQKWTWHHGWYSTDLIAAHVLRNDLPCCGGEFVLEREYVDYSTLQRGHCAACRAKWQITDGHNFHRS